jgi:mono/diheme cytochrome c family protein
MNAEVRRTPTVLYFELKERPPMERNISRLACVLVLSAIGFGEAAAETIGNLQDGLALAQQVCSQCHATVREQDRSPNPKAPRFAELASTSGMTATALLVALTTPHAGMPMFTFTTGQRDDIIAYILSLR